MNHISQDDNSTEVQELIGTARKIAARYKEITGKPLGITGEVGELEVSRIFQCKLEKARNKGYDTIHKGNRVQIKTRSTTGGKRTGRTGAINVSGEWDLIYLVLLDEGYCTREIHMITKDLIKKTYNDNEQKTNNGHGDSGIAKGKFPISTLTNESGSTLIYPF